MLRCATALSLTAVVACGSDGHAPGRLEDAGRDPAGPDAALDAGAPSAEDAGQATSDAGTGCVAFQMPTDCTNESGPLPDALRCSGLYGDWERRELACGVREYKPAFELWSDGAVKRRFVQLPPGSTIDVSDPDAFVYPVGTQFWKEFSVQVEGALRRAETRLLRKVEAGWLYTAYVWDPDESAALQVNEGVANWNGSGHTVPTREQCAECHEGRADRVLGWDFLMLGPGASGVTRELLAAEGSLSPAAVPSLLVPGDDVERAALGYLHANCGVSCHNDSPSAEARDTGLFMRLEADALASVFTTAVFTTGVNQRPSWRADIHELSAPEGGFYRIKPLDLAATLLLPRMAARGNAAQMPPLATNLVDTDGLDRVSAWVEHMTEANGYPPPDATTSASLAGP